jgi:dihydrofolate reductase
VFNEAMATGAVITGRRTFELAGQWGGDHHDRVPILVLTHEIPGSEPPGSARYVTDVAEAAPLRKPARVTRT